MKKKKTQQQIIKGFWGQIANFTCSRVVFDLDITNIYIECAHMPACTSYTQLTQDYKIPIACRLLSGLPSTCVREVCLLTLHVRP